MDILVLSWRDPKHPLAGGAEQVMHEHMKGWIEAGHEVTLFSSHFKGGKRQEVLDGVKIIRRGIQYWGVHFAAAFHYLFGKHKKYDLVVDQFHGIPFFTPLYVRVPKLAVIQEVAREVWLKNDLPFPFNKIIGWIGYLGEPLLFIFYRRVLFMTGSESAKKDLQKMGISEKNITIVPHGVILNLPERLPIKEETRTIIFLGALAKDKGIEDAIEAFDLLNQKGKYKFWVVGRAAEGYLNYLKEKVKEYGLKDKVQFFGFVSQEKKFELLARAHILINPSLLEGFGLVNIEANAAGTPVVGYRSKGLVDSINHKKSGILVDERSPKKLANAIDKILNSKKFYKKLQDGAVEWSENFDWDKSKKLSLELVEETGHA